MQYTCGRLDHHDTWHLLTRRSEQGAWQPACGAGQLSYEPVEVTPEVDRVTCPLCQRTVAYRDLAESSEPIC